MAFSTNDAKAVDVLGGGGGMNFDLYFLAYTKLIQDRPQM